MRSKSNGMTFRCTAAVVSGLLALSSVSPALAQVSATAKTTASAAPQKKLTPAQAKVEAKKHYDAAEAKFAKGDFAGAAEDYLAADVLIPGAVPKFKHADSVDKQNKPVEAVAAYQAFLDSKPEDRHKDRIDAATARIKALQATPATITVSVEPASATNLKLAVDGAAVEGTTFDVAPGQHAISATADGFEGKQDVTATFAEKKAITIALTPVAVAATDSPAVDGAAAATTPAAPADGEGPKAEKRSNVPAYITLGLAAVGLGVGTGFGIAALGSQSDFNAAPSRDGLDKVEREALLADMSFAVGITFGVTGLVLLLTNTGDSSSKASALTKPVIAPYASQDGGGAAAMFRF